MHFQSLQSIMLAIAQARSVEPILQQIVSGVAEMSSVALVRLWLLTTAAECEHCASLLSPPDSSTTERSLHLVASAGTSLVDGTPFTMVTGRSHRLALGERKIGRIAQSGQPLLIPDVTADQPWVADPAWIQREGIRSFAGQPLVCRGEVLGVLAVFSRVRFSDEEFQWLRTFADHAAVAIWNARAFDELNRLRMQLERENEYLTEEIRESLHPGAMIGKSGSLQNVLERVRLVAGTDATVLIQGESGTGKELVARAIHDLSPRRNRPLVKVNCGAVPEQLFESEFFGHVKGAFTGAIKDRLGRFELADGGDLFLDEVGEIPLSLQAKLLRVLQDRQFERVGEARTRRVNVRVMAATNRNLREEVAAGRFREDLYYRLTVFPIDVPPLRDRKEDLPLLAEHFLRKSAARLKIEPPRLTSEHLRELQNYTWPGNIRELENVIERATILSRGSGRLLLNLGAPAFSKGAARPSAGPEKNVLTRAEWKVREKANIEEALRVCHGRIFGNEGAARRLGMPPTTLASRIKALGIERHPAR